MGDKGKHWVALEANPEVLTEFMHKLGASHQYEFVGMSQLVDNKQRNCG